MPNGKSNSAAIGRGNHWLTPYFVEQWSEHHGAEEAANREQQQVPRQVIIAYVRKTF